MKKEALYRMATKADKEAREGEKYYCPFCFCLLIKRKLISSRFFKMGERK